MVLDGTVLTVDRFASRTNRSLASPRWDVRWKRARGATTTEVYLRQFTNVQAQMLKCRIVDGNVAFVRWKEIRDVRRLAKAGDVFCVFKSSGFTLVGN